MAYFNHAFRKCYVLNQDVVSTAGTATSALAAGQMALVDTSFESVVNTAWGTLSGQFVLAAGSYHTVDTIGNNPGHGGYSESVKSKGINPKYISRVWKTPVCAATAATAEVALASDCVPCGSSIFLRMDVKGSPALRFLNHNAYAIGDSANVCCVDGQDYIDPAAALAEAGKQLLADPILAPFVREKSGGGVEITRTGLAAVVAPLGALVVGSGYTDGTYTSVPVSGGTGSGLTLDLTVSGGAVVATPTIACPGQGYTVSDVLTILVPGGTAGTPSTINVATVADTASYTIAEVQGSGYVESTDPVTDGVSAKLQVEGAYVDTQFGNCSFDTRDHYEKEPVQIILSNLDETGEPCNDCGVASRTTGVMAQISGETVLRDLLMSERYMQMPYNQGNADSSRIREIEHSDDIVSAVDRSGRYVSLNLLHSVPRFNNPSGVFDNDQYLYTFYAVAGSAGETALDTLFGQIAALASVDAVLDTTDACGSPCTI